jgi:hypothetical protein
MISDEEFHQDLKWRRHFLKSPGANTLSQKIKKWHQFAMSLLNARRASATGLRYIRVAETFKDVILTCYEGALNCG